MTNVETVTIAIVGADDSIAIMSFVTKEFAADGSVNWSRMADAPAIDAEIRSMTTPNEQGVCSLGNERVPIKAWYPIDPKDVPTDRTYREALRHDGTRFSYDLPAAKAQALIAIRAARGEQMTVLDGQWMRATGKGDAAAAAAIEAQRQVLRDQPATFLAATTNATTIEQLHAARPDVT